MNGTMRLVLCILVTACLSACDDQEFTEFWYRGTQIAVEACIKRNTSNIIDAAAIKGACINKHETVIAPGNFFTGSTMGKGTVVVNLRNTMEGKIVTGILVTIQTTADHGKDLVIQGRSKGLWVMPKTVEQAYVSFDEANSEKPWSEIRERITNGADWSWMITGATVVKFELR